MGYRTVVILNNDLAHMWERDASLGDLIAQRASQFPSTPAKSGYFKYGTVIEVAHADQQTLGTLDSLTFLPLATGHWHHGQEPTQRDVKLLMDAADKLGYRLVRKPDLRSTKQRAAAKVAATPKPIVAGE